MIASNCDTAIAHKKRPLQTLLNLKQSLANVFKTLQCWQQRSQQRRELKQLIEDADLLKDIGLSKSDVIKEVHKRFWQK